MRHVALGLGLLALVAIVASCGGGGGGSDDPPPVPAALQILPADRQVSHNEETDAQWPQVAAWDDNVYVVWSVFGGPGIATAYGIGVASHHESAYVDWADDRAGFLRIHANRARP